MASIAGDGRASDGTDYGHRQSHSEFEMLTGQGVGISGQRNGVAFTAETKDRREKSGSIFDRLGLTMTNSNIDDEQMSQVYSQRLQPAVTSLTNLSTKLALCHITT